MSRTELVLAVDEAIKVLDARSSSELLPYDYIHFQRQRTYVFDGDVRVVRTLFPLERVSDLFRHVGRLTGSIVESGTNRESSHENKSELFKTDFLARLAKPLLPFYSRSVKSWLPVPIRNLMGTYLLVDQSKRYRDVIDSVHVRQFIGEYYSGDIELFDQARSQYVNDGNV